MKDNLKNLTSKLTPLFNKTKQYKVFIFILVLLSLYGFLVFRINVLNSKTPTDEEVSAQLERTTKPRLDQSVKDKIQQLQDNSVEVRSLFNEARNNPFHE